MPTPPELALSPSYRICTLAKAIERTGMRPGRDTLLLAIRHGGPMSLAALARSCEVSTISISLMLRRLEDAGLVDRDGPLILTERGEALRDGLPAAWGMLDARMLSGFDGSDRAILTNLLRRIAL